MTKLVMDAIDRDAACQTDNTCDHCLPGVPLICLYVDNRYNYEDSVIVSDEINDRGWMSMTITMNHPLPSRVQVPELGSTVTPKMAW